MSKEKHAAVGQLIEVGPAPYQFDAENDESNFARLRDQNGKETVLWGKNIPKALQSAGLIIGDYIRLEQREEESVVINAVVKDEGGKRVGRKEQEAVRYEWFAEAVEIKESERVLEPIEENIISPVVEQSQVDEENLATERSLEPQQNTANTIEDAITPVNLKSNVGIVEDTITAVQNKTTAEKIIGSDGKNAPTSLLKGRFVRDDQGNYRRIGETSIALTDEGERIRFVDKQSDTFCAGVELVKAKGWDAIQVTGSEKFCSEAWFQARKEGLEVLGYEPNAKDLKRLALAQTQEQGPNKDLSASQREAELFALNRVGGLQQVNTERGRYVGRIVHETEHHLVQGLGRGVAVIHDKNNISKNDLKKADFSKNLSMQYQAGRAVFHVERLPQHSRSL